ncbi:ABC transporter substrate-binding protein [Streptomyces sp. NPDC051940]|uniref:ABC transporter substrate-binding protein n=1 Tax=Streptomyces sp. NPDC051940 TaxID=3155675 RepID=UPI00342DB8C6
MKQSARKQSARRLAVVSATALALMVTGCSSKADEGAGTTEGGVKTGPGISAKKITLGTLTDISGPGAALGKPLLQSMQLTFEKANKDGGVCGRTIELEVRDHGLDVQKAVAGYAELKDKVAAMPMLVGSAQTAALMDSLEKDKMLTFAGSFSSTLLGHNALQVVGTTYAVDMVNGLPYLVETAGLKAGDKVGVVYVDGEYGGDALKGLKYAAEKAGVTLVEQAVKPTDSDMTAQVTALKQAGVKAIAAAVLPPQTASLVGVAAASGLQVPVLANGTAFAPQLLATPAGPAIEKMLRLSTPFGPVTGDSPTLKAAVAAYQAKYPQEPLSQAVQVGALDAGIVVDALKNACKAGDLSREGILKALRGMKDYDSLVGKLDFSDTSMPSSAASYVLKPSKAAPGGLVLEREATEAPDTAGYLAQG